MFGFSGGEGFDVTVFVGVDLFGDEDNKVVFSGGGKKGCDHVAEGAHDVFGVTVEMKAVVEVDGVDDDHMNVGAGGEVFDDLVLFFEGEGSVEDDFFEGVFAGRGASADLSEAFDGYAFGVDEGNSFVLFSAGFCGLEAEIGFSGGGFAIDFGDDAGFETVAE